MKYQLYITKNAERDLEDAADYIEFTLKNPAAADRLLNIAEEELQELTLFPKSHPVIDDPVLSVWGVRFIVIENYLAFYIVEDSIVYIIRFLYGKRNWITVLKQGFTLK